MPDPTKSCKADVLKAAVLIAKTQGLFLFSRIDVAKAASVSEGIITYHFGNMTKLRKAIVEHAVQNEILSILADARAGRESIGVPMNQQLRKKVATYIAS